MVYRDQLLPAWVKLQTSFREYYADSAHLPLPDGRTDHVIATLLVWAWEVFRIEFKAKDTELKDKIIEVEGVD